MSANAKVYSDHAEFFMELNKGVVVRTTQELYEHFLNVLPPISMGFGQFVFGEGSDRIKFWREDDGYNARYTRLQLGSSDGEGWLDTGWEPDSSHYRVIDSYGAGDVVGKCFASLEEAVKALDLKLR